MHYKGYLPKIISVLDYSKNCYAAAGIKGIALDRYGVCFLIRPEIGKSKVSLSRLNSAPRVGVNGLKFESM